MTDFIIVEILFKHNQMIMQVPIIHKIDKLSAFIHCIDKADDILAYQVIDSVPVPPKHFGWGPDWKKWVVKFTQEMFDSE